jgi:signal transduction histidine kinase
MDRIVTDLLTIAREGEDVTDPQAIDLGTVLVESWETVETEGATLSLSGVEDRVVVADGGRLGQLLENLYRNCVEHGTRGDEGVSVTVGWIDGESSGFYVADDGPGIPPGEREAVFETGFSTNEEGTGFGLSIAARVASGHGWDIAVTESEDGGARFEVTGIETR